MKVGNKKVVSMVYDLRKENASGESIQKVEKETPFVCLFGVGGLLPKFEENLEGLVAGDTFGFSLTAEEAYGNPVSEAIVDLDKSIFEIEGKIDDKMLEIGNVIPMMNQDGQPLQGRVLQVGETSVKMDFNHPLAGIPLHFSGEILNVRDASEEELAHGHAH